MVAKEIINSFLPQRITLMKNLKLFNIKNKDNSQYYKYIVTQDSLKSHSRVTQESLKSHSRFTQDSLKSHSRFISILYTSTYKKFYQKIILNYLVLKKIISYFLPQRITLTKIGSVKKFKIIQYYK